MGLDLNTCTVAGCSKAALGVGAWLGLPLVIENTECEFRQTCLALMCAVIHDGTQEASDSTPGGSPRCAAIHDCAQGASDLMQGV